MEQSHSPANHGPSLRPPPPDTGETGPEIVDGAACPYPAWSAPQRLRLTVLGEHPCPYLPGRVAQSRAVWAERMRPQMYHAMMDAGFRRSGKLIYQPICRGCRECLPLRVPVQTFRPDKSQRRCARRNADLVVTHAAPQISDEKWDLYRRYIEQWHGRPAENRESLEQFLYETPVETLEFTYRDQTGRLLAVGICDLCPSALSSVYFYFDPTEASRSLGTFGALHELQFAQIHQIPYYYLGYWIDRCMSMRYKAMYQPSEVLHPDNAWRSMQAR